MQSNLSMGGLPGPGDAEDWTTFWGYVATVEDAMLLIEATNRGIYQRVTSRLHPRESISIRSGAVFVFDEEESKMKRWTDKLLWSPSRQVGNFFVYRQMVTKVPRGTRVKDIEAMSLAAQGGVVTPIDPEVQAAERQYVGSLTSGPQYPRDGLVKKALAIGTLHVVSYFTLDDVMNGRLQTPSQSPELQGLAVSPRLESMANVSLPEPSAMRSSYQAYPTNLPADSSSSRAFSPYKPVTGRASTSPSFSLIPLRSDSYRSHSVPSMCPRASSPYQAHQANIPSTMHLGTTAPAVPWGHLRLDLGTDQQHTLPRRASDAGIGGPPGHITGSYESWTLQQTRLPIQQAATIPGFSSATFLHAPPQQPPVPVPSAPREVQNLNYRRPSEYGRSFPSSAPGSFDRTGQQSHRVSSLGLVSSGGYSPPSDMLHELYLQDMERQRQQWVYVPTQQIPDWPSDQVTYNSASSTVHGQQEAAHPYHHHMQ